VTGPKDPRTAKVLFVATPLVAGVVCGGLAGILGVLLLKVLGVSLSPKQANVGYIAFPAGFGLFGLIDSANRFVGLLAYRRDGSGRRPG
jgi:hypothetical protein